MEIRTLGQCERALASGAKQTYPKGWEGAVPRELGELWIKHGRAVEVVIEAGTFTPEQTAVLRTAADQISNAQADAGEIDLEAASDEELQGYAKQLGVKTTPNMKRETLIKRIVDAYEALEEQAG